MDTEGFKITVFSEEDRSPFITAAEKPLVYLDSNVWIDLCERFPKMAELCRHLVRNNKAIFPVSFSSINEVFEQPSETKRLCVAALMDDLSKGLSFRPSKTIHDMEADLALPIVLGSPSASFERHKILTWIVEFAGKMILKFPPSWKQGDANKFHHLLIGRQELRSVKWLVENLNGNEMRIENAERMHRYVVALTANIKESNLKFKHLAKDVRRRQFLLEEHTAIVKKLISPKMSRKLLKIVGPDKLLSTIDAISKQVGEGGKKRLDQIMRAMPSLDLYCHILAERACNSARKVRAQDFYDVEHAIVGGAYADFFITSDGNLFDLLTNQCKVSAERNCRIVRGIKGLEETLKQLSD